MVGPTLACLIGKQFHNFRHGDRFWYENGGWPSSFTLEQLAEIRRVKLPRVLCDNSDDLETVQVCSVDQGWKRDYQKKGWGEAIYYFSY